MLESESAWRLLRACRWVHLPHHLLKRSLTPLRFPALITQNADTGITTCTNNADKAFSFQCAGTSATGYRQKDDSSSLYLDIQGYTGNPLRLYTDGAYNTSGSGSMNCTQGTYRSNHKGQWEMYNLVRENGRSAARLTAWAESGYGTVIGVWSPDCVGHFRKLPA